MPEKPKPVEMVQLSRENRKKAKESVKKLIERYKNLAAAMKIVDETSVHDQPFEDFLQLIEEGDLNTGTSGTARLGQLEDEED